MKHKLIKGGIILLAIGDILGLMTRDIGCGITPIVPTYRIKIPVPKAKAMEKAMDSMVRRFNAEEKTTITPPKETDIKKNKTDSDTVT